MLCLVNITVLYEGKEMLSESYCINQLFACEDGTSCMLRTNSGIVPTLLGGCGGGTSRAVLHVGLLCSSCLTIVINLEV